MKLTLAQAAVWMQSTTASAETATGYSIDTRTLQPGDLFFAVVGERLDGHDYVQAALERGAIAAVVRRGWVTSTPEEKLIRVDEPLPAMQRLAAAVRKHWGKRVIGVTGSAGKTTTKEMVATVLSARFNTLKSLGNLNNNFGVPLQLLRLEPEHEVAVIEMGMNHAGEIAELAKIAAPDWAVVSNVAPVHLEHFPDGIGGIARAKYELVEALPSSGIAFLNADDSFVSKFGDNRSGRNIFYGLEVTADLRAEAIEEAGAEGIRFTAIAGTEQEPVHLALMGRHNVYNALAGIAVGLASGMSLAECARAAEQMRPSDKRGEILHLHGASLINDCYNSNPRALDAMVDALLAVKASRHIVVAGEMLELGPDAAALHAACGHRMAERGITLVIGVRGHAKSLVEAAEAAGAEAHFVATPEEAGDWLEGNLRDGDAVLLKASRGVQLERALKRLQA